MLNFRLKLRNLEKHQNCAHDSEPFSKNLENANWKQKCRVGHSRKAVRFNSDLPFRKIFGSSWARLSHFVNNLQVRKRKLEKALELRSQVRVRVRVRTAWRVHHERIAYNRSRATLHKKKMEAAARGARKAAVYYIPPGNSLPGRNRALNSEAIKHTTSSAGCIPCRERRSNSPAILHHLLF